MSKIGIVTVLYNGESVLPEFFESLDKQSYKDFILYIVDNNSKDNGLQLCWKLSESVGFPCKIFSEKENHGVAKGNNIGIIAALNDRCDYILLSNNDIVLKPNTISLLVEGLERHGADMTIPKIYFHDSGKIWCAGGGFSKLRGITYHIGFNEDENHQYENDREIQYSPTCFMLIKASVFYDVGLMDEKYFVYYDDSDFVWRSVVQHNKKLMYIAESKLDHKVSSSTGGGESEFTIYYSNRNNVYFRRKNFPLFYKIISNIYRGISRKLKMRNNPEKKKIIVKAIQDAKNI